MNTQAHVRKETQVLQPAVTVAVDFNKPVAQVENLPPDLLDVDRLTGLATAAMLFSHPDAAYTDERTQAVAYLSMFAAGASVKLSKQQFRLLESKALDFAAGAYEGGLSEQASIAMFAVRQAKQRATSEGIIGERPLRQEGLAEVDFDCGRGYGSMDSGLSAGFDASAPRQDKLLSFAAMFAHINPGRTNSASQAVVYLALYALGSRVSLSKQQFRSLERRVKTYLSTMKAERLRDLPNGSRAHYVLVQALRRARKNGLV